MRVRPMTDDDVAAVVDLQEAGALATLAAVFPQDRYPFPRAPIAARWSDEIRDPSIDTYVALGDDGRLIGFVATSGSELLHLGTAVDTWGNGTASELLEVVVRRLRVHGGRPVLFVLEGNVRGRRFYEKHGWRPTGATCADDAPPHPQLLEYVLPEA